MRARSRDDDRGSILVELIGYFWIFAMVALMALQLASIGGAMNAAENAARNASRAAGMLRDPASAAYSSVDPVMRRRTTVVPQGLERMSVRIDVPVVIPGIDTTVVTIERTAELPRTWP